MYQSGILRLVNGTSTEASLAPGIDRFYSTKSWPGELHMYRGWNKQPYNSSKQSVCPLSLEENALARSILLLSKDVPLFFNIKGTLLSDMFVYNEK